MIQRIQTVWLLFVLGLAVATFMILPVVNTIDNIWSRLNWLLCFHAAIFSLIAIFRYKNRKRQLHWCYVVVGLLCAEYIQMGLSLWFVHQSFAMEYLRFTAVFPFIALVFDSMAIRAIKKDDKLVRSLDRLR
ncbi:MAG: hypothetical protein EZS26_001421 [Candidatus Ordinivivax streblomastigis]|jgi:peptidoglycan/LPS O-acetylase OafA/YrhL|uniref:DUF4293 family protein n=1 Tax=Candidatus Ordinivivax streblomastigis TaxID=2540710 RepID=A0A5M8P1N6_9BACT|nr:MAG: hypothetical protein EZS26_001421 [Candidatus Ordinivivax streblomastigis]MDR2844154.1 DUF4293 domain-containing protein [Candidatus Symbiothrix sp.]